MSDGTRTLSFVRLDGSRESPPLYLILKHVFERLAPERRASVDDAISDWIHHFGALPGDGLEQIYRLTVGNGVSVQVAHALDSIPDPWVFEVNAPVEQVDGVADALLEAAVSMGLRPVSRP